MLLNTNVADRRLFWISLFAQCLLPFFTDRIRLSLLTMNERERTLLSKIYIEVAGLGWPDIDQKSLAKLTHV